MPRKSHTAAQDPQHQPKVVKTLPVLIFAEKYNSGSPGESSSVPDKQGIGSPWPEELPDYEASSLCNLRNKRNKRVLMPSPHKVPVSQPEPDASICDSQPAQNHLC